MTATTAEVPEKLAIHTEINNLLQAYHYLGTFEKKLEPILSNPEYPIAAGLLAKLFQSLIKDTQLMLKDTEKELIPLIRQKDQIEEKLTKKKQSPKDRKTLESIKTEKLPRLDRTIKRTIVFFRELAALLRYIETASIESVPLSILYHFKKVLHPNEKYYIFIRRQWRSNFKFAEFISNISGRENTPSAIEESITKHANFRICMVSIPILEQDNYLTNCLIAHEVAHYFNEIHPMDEDFEAWMPKIAIAKSDDKADRDEKIAISKWLTAIANKWNKELKADVCATMLLGPAYAFALLEFELPNHHLDQFILGVQPAEQAYPSLRMRLYFILGALKFIGYSTEVLQGFKEIKLDWIDILRGELEKLKGLIKDEKFKGVSEHGHADLIWQVVKKRAEHIYKYFYNQLTTDGLEPDNVCSPDKLFRNKYSIQQIESKLNKLIPINEIVENETLKDNKKVVYSTKPLDVDVIINFAWLEYLKLRAQYIQRFPNEQKMKVAQSRIESFLRIIKRSVDASYFHKEFNDCKELLE